MSVVLIIFEKGLQSYILVWVGLEDSDHANVDQFQQSQKGNNEFGDCPVLGEKVSKVDGSLIFQAFKDKRRLLSEGPFLKLYLQWDPWKPLVKDPLESIHELEEIDIQKWFFTFQLTRVVGGQPTGKDISVQ